MHESARTVTDERKDPAIRRALERLLRGETLPGGEAGELLVALTDESLPPAVGGAALAALRAKGETPEEVCGLAGAMRRLARKPQLPPELPAVDIVGTGGDGSGSLNLSTGAALLTAACGRPVVKHGNRSVSSRSGSADVLEALGYAMPHDERSAADSLARTGFTFLFAPTFHPAMKAIAPVRQALGVRTVFNVLGPLTNPAEPPFGVVGAFDVATAELIAGAFSGLPIERVFVVHGDNGWDEATPASPFLLLDVRPGNIVRMRRDPRDYGLNRCDDVELAGSDAAQNARAIRSAFDGERAPHRDALLLGAALALEVTGVAHGLEQGIEQAAAAIDDGRAARLLEQLNTGEGTRG